MGYFITGEPKLRLPTRWLPTPPLRDRLWSFFIKRKEKTNLFHEVDITVCESFTVFETALTVVIKYGKKDSHVSACPIAADSVGREASISRS